ncbi:MAG: zinc-ribbon domain-containing protein [Selenomonas sp.]|uniref:zinc-ribbon domain-containing protein n=1 Tax=Selenomonas sp. TaxID=2053611 RepID=UPI0025FAC432|nr:zinc ribbon domain-containing protein [Selenomonas sp.]MCR5439313.1 zinc-ribbon domain-containing protein [Selenomonas sp.]
MFCKNCGEQLPDNAHFCKKCGIPIAVNPVRKLPAPSGSPSKSIKIILAVLAIVILIFGSIQVHNRKLAEHPSSQPTVEEQQQQQQPKQEQKAAQKKPQPAPNTPQIALDGIQIKKNAWGEPQLHLDIRNTDAEKTIDKYRIVVYAFDSKGLLLKSSINATSCYHGSGDFPIAPGETLKSSKSWILHGFDNGQKFRAKVIYLHYTDDTEWKAANGQDISLTGTIS